MSKHRYSIIPAEKDTTVLIVEVLDAGLRFTPGSLTKRYEKVMAWRVRDDRNYVEPILLRGEFKELGERVFVRSYGGGFHDCNFHVCKFNDEEQVLEHVLNDLNRKYSIARMRTFHAVDDYCKMDQIDGVVTEEFAEQD
jgi:hypothetical protein